MMRRKLLIPTTAVIVTVVAAVLIAQESGDLTIRQRVDEVIAPTTVLDKDGVYVTGLKPMEFRLYDNDKLQTIKVDEIVSPVSLVVAIQADYKVEKVLPKIQKIGTLLQNMVAGDSGEVAIISFDHRIQKLQDFTSDPDKITEALKKLKPGSSQAVLTDAVNEGARMLEQRPKERRRVVLLIAESLDKGSEGRAREALTRLEFANVIVYALNMSRVYTALTAKDPPPRQDPIPPEARHVPAGMPSTPQTAAQLTGARGYGAQFVPVITEIFRGVRGVFVPNPIEIYTQYTGGKEEPFVSQSDLERATQNIGREIHNQYLITYNPNNKGEGGLHNIRVDVTRRGLEVRTRRGYWMATVQ
ncbi:MAG TPA: VWA domain-containing protein [Bryobacteraceae bacterium]|nr:VWA domain-containing protein [Bryobacteraceae bacterium]